MHAKIQHDAVLGHLLEKHEGKPELMIDTLLDFINRSTDFFSGPGGDGGDGGDGDGAQKLAAVCGRFADFLGMVGGAAASGGSEFAARLAVANAAARAVRFWFLCGARQAGLPSVCAHTLAWQCTHSPAIRRAQKWLECRARDNRFSLVCIVRPSLAEANSIM